MIRRLLEWMDRRWQPIEPTELEKAYLRTFSTLEGRLVLQHLFDSVYCTVYEGTDPHECLVHNARRGVIQELLENLDRAETPEKYRTGEEA